MVDDISKECKQAHLGLQLGGDNNTLANPDTSPLGKSEDCIDDKEVRLVLKV